LRMIYTMGRVHASDPVDRSTEPIRGTYRVHIPPRHHILPPTNTCRHYVTVGTRARARVRVWSPHRHKTPYVRQTATRRQHNTANTKADKIGAQTAVLRTPAGTHAFFAHNYPSTYTDPNVYMDLLSLLARCSLLLLDGREPPRSTL